jgi:hypothetical protein
MLDLIRRLFATQLPLITLRTIERPGAVQRGPAN